MDNEALVEKLPSERPAPLGAFLLLPVREMVAAWHMLTLSEFRVWLALREAKERRRVAKRCARSEAKRRSPRYTLSELERLTGLSPRTVRESVRTLSKHKLASLSERAIRFAQLETGDAPPHADDETYGCAGTIAKAKDLGAEVYVVVVTVGDLAHYDGGQDITSGETRAHEFSEVMKYLRVDDHEVLFRDPQTHLRLDAIPRRDLIALFERDGRLSIDRLQPTMVMLPAVSYLGPTAAGLLTGSVVVETVFGIPGIGRYFVQGALGRDYTLVMGTVVVIAIFIIAFNLIVDLLYAFLDPRVRFD